MAMAHAGFVFLSMTKTGSTSVEAAFARHAQLSTRRPPPMKHMTARTFDSLIAPLLEHYGFARESYELVCVAREPVDWVHSWWRYRSRPDAGHPVEVDFDTFAAQVVSGEVRLGSTHNFTRVGPGRPPVERVYRYEHLPAAVSWMADRLGVVPPDLERRNASPRPRSEVSAATRRLLEEHYARDLAIYRAAR